MLTQFYGLTYTVFENKALPDKIAAAFYESI